MLALVFSTAREAAPFLARYERGRFDGLGEGDAAHDERLLVAITGLGKIKATLHTERLLVRHKPAGLLHVGLCTGLDEAHAVGTLLTAREVFEGDHTELSTPVYPRMPLEPVDLAEATPVVLVTQDHRPAGADELSYWQRIAGATDATGYAVAYVAARHGVGCRILKCVAGHLMVDDPNLRQTRERAAEHLAATLLKRIDALAPAGR